MAGGTSHSVTLTGLTAGTTYQYLGAGQGPAGNSAEGTNASFRTAGTGADTTPLTISGVQVTDVTATTATVTWTTNEAATGQVQYGLTTAYGSTSSIVAGGTSHSVTLTGLTPETTYNYRVQATDTADNATTGDNASFTTAVTATSPTPPAPPPSLASGTGWGRLSTGSGAYGWYFSAAVVERSGAGRIWHTWKGVTYLYDPATEPWSVVAGATDIGWRENFGADHDARNNVIWVGPGPRSPGLGMALLTYALDDATYTYTGEFGCGGNAVFAWDQARTGSTALVGGPRSPRSRPRARSPPGRGSR